MQIYFSFTLTFKVQTKMLVAQIITLQFIILLFSNITNAQLQLRIVGGNGISVESCPYQLSLMKNNKHICGAVIISKQWAITSAHCLEGLLVKDISLRAGSNSHASGGTLHKAVRSIVHPAYDKEIKDYDIALIEVIPNFDLSKVKAITLVSDGSVIKSGSQVYVTGWGTLTQGGTILSNKLQQITIPIVEKQICTLAIGKQISDRMICAGLTSGGKDICNGDYGGPMVYQDKLVGISSWSAGCGQPGSFGVYTYISTVRSWIKQITRI